MGILITCLKCGKQYEIDPRYSGRKVKCRRCREIIGVPSALERPKNLQPSLIQFGHKATSGQSGPPSTAEAVLHLVECSSCGKIHQLPESLPGKKESFLCQCGNKLKRPASRSKSSSNEPPEVYEVVEGLHDMDGTPTEMDDFASLEAEFTDPSSPEDDAAFAVTAAVQTIPEPPLVAATLVRGPRPQTPDESAGSSRRWLWVGLAVFGGVAVLTAIIVATVIMSRGLFGDASEQALFPLDSIPAPPMPELPPAKVLEPGITFREVSFGPGGGYPSTPGHGGKLWIYLPEGQHDPGSLACVLAAPAGTNLLTGIDLQNSDRPEHLPYVRAGLAVVAYSLDGPLAGAPEKASNADFARAYKSFRAAQAGLINARNALEFVLAKLPEVDPGRIYAAGHSSAGTTALLLSEHEPRISACVAYAPCTDLAARLGELVHAPDVSSILPGVKSFIIRSSPRTHESQLTCPVFLFHAADDQNVPVADSINLADRLRTQGRTVELVTNISGGHYDPMLSAGIPQAIEWLKGLKP